MVYLKARVAKLKDSLKLYMPKDKLSIQTKNKAITSSSTMNVDQDSSLIKASNQLKTLVHMKEIKDKKKKERKASSTILVDLFHQHHMLLRKNPNEMTFHKEKCPSPKDQDNKSLIEIINQKATKHL